MFPEDPAEMGLAETALFCQLIRSYFMTEVFMYIRQSRLDLRAADCLHRTFGYTLFVYSQKTKHEDLDQIMHHISVIIVLLLHLTEYFPHYGSKLGAIFTIKENGCPFYCLWPWGYIYISVNLLKFVFLKPQLHVYFDKGFFFFFYHRL